MTNSSAVAVDALERRGFACYNPVVLDRHRTVQLFPSYLFVEIIGRWRELLSAKGVARLLMAAPEVPATIPDDQIAAIRLREDQYGHVRVENEQFRKGRIFHLIRGPLAFEKVLFDSMVGSDRALVLLSWLGSKRFVRVDLDNLAAA